MTEVYRAEWPRKKEIKIECLLCLPVQKTQHQMQLTIAKLRKREEEVLSSDVSDG